MLKPEPSKQRPPVPAADLDPERLLALAYAPARCRAALALLWRLDGRLGAVLAREGGPMLAAIRLAWWRDALAALDGGPPPRDPLLIEVGAVLPAIGVAGAALSDWAQGWVALTQGEEEEALEEHAALRGGRLFALSSRIAIGREAPGVAVAGERWALADRLGVFGPLAAERAAQRSGPGHWPRGLRALGVLSALATRDLRRAQAGEALEPRGSPARIARALWMGISGR